MSHDFPYSIVAPDVEIGEGVSIVGFVNLYGCKIGDGTKIGPFVEIQRGVTVGARCKIQSHTFICTGVTIEDEVFIGHGVMFTNDRNPRSVNHRGELSDDADWELEETVIRRGANLGSGVTVLPGIEIGAGAIVGAGAVVTADVAAGSTVVGVPARPV